MKTREEKLRSFIEKANEVHGDRYDYSKVDYYDSKTSVCIICPEHGEFMQTPAAHVRGNKCPKCANKERGRYKRLDTEKFIKRAEKIHKGKYDYSKVEYTSVTGNVTIICPEHGEFTQKAMNHLLGQGCPKCMGRGLTNDEVVSRFRSVHGDRYDYSKVEYSKSNEKVCIICPEHGEFMQTPSKHLSGQGCPKCACERRFSGQVLSTEEFIEKALEVHGDVYSYDKVEYKGSHTPVTITCKVHGDFEQIPNDHLCGHGCPICGGNISFGESSIADYVRSLGFDVVERDRNVLNGHEIDIFVPSKNIGIEFDGLRWHSDKFKKKMYHLWKTKACMEKGVRLIHIYEDEWVDKEPIVKSMISNILGKTERRIFARNCEVKKVSDMVKKSFLDENHIQGNVVSRINYGLFHNDELVALMCFGKQRVNLGKKHIDDGEYELLRFCNKKNTNVVGGASRLFKHFVVDYNPKVILSYCDRRWSVGGMYEKLGFTFSHASQPNYYYVIGKKRYNRFKFRKSELIKEGYDEKLSEKDIMENRGINRIYDCGSYVYIWKGTIYN